MSVIAQVIEVLTGAPAEFTESVVKIGVADASSTLWSRLKGLFTAHGTQNSEELQGIEPGSEIRLDDLIRALAEIPEDVLQGAVVQSMEGPSRTRIATAKGHGTVTVHGDIAGRDITK